MFFIFIMLFFKIIMKKVLYLTFFPDGLATGATPGTGPVALEINDLWM
jgi:hypothetical protein